MKIVSAVIFLVFAGLSSSCVDHRSYRAGGYSGGIGHSTSCGNGENDISHPYAGICDWRRENGRDWADSGANNNIYRRNR